MIFSRSIAVLLLLLSGEGVFAHGKISLAECYRDNGEIGVRVEKEMADDLQLLTFKAGNQKDQVFKSASVQIKDEVEKNKVVESLVVRSGDLRLNLRIPEVYEHKIRRGRGELKLAKATTQKFKDCYLVYE